MKFNQIYEFGKRTRFQENFVETSSRRVKRCDIEELSRIFSQIYSSDNKFSKILALSAYRYFGEIPGCALFATFDGARMLSICSISFVPKITHAGVDTALIGFIYTDSDFRQLGFGRVVLQSAVEAAEEFGARRVTLIADRDDYVVGRLCRRQGFELRNCQYIKFLT